MVVYASAYHRSIRAHSIYLSSYVSPNSLVGRPLVSVQLNCTHWLNVHSGSGCGSSHLLLTAARLIGSTFGLRTPSKRWQTSFLKSSMSTQRSVRRSWRCARRSMLTPLTCPLSCASLRAVWTTWLLPPILSSSLCSRPCWIANAQWCPHSKSVTTYALCHGQCVVGRGRTFYSLQISL